MGMIEFLKKNVLEFSRLIVELVLFISFVKFSRRRTDSHIIKLDEDEVDEIIKKFKPERLVNIKCDDKLIERPLTEDNTPYVDLTDFDFYNLKNENKPELVKTIKEYGIGTCGPPGFYGTLDLHLELEKAIAERVGKEAAILYSNHFTAVGSAINCFIRRYDVVLFHSDCNEAILRGIVSTKANSYEFRTVSDLESLLKTKFSGERRYFVITEGIFRNTGKCFDIKSIAKLKKEYPFWFILDDSLSFSFLELQKEAVDILIGSLSYSLCSAGGFVAGSEHSVDYQRLLSPSYCFSASLPAFLTKNALLNLKKDLKSRRKAILEKVKHFHEKFNNVFLNETEHKKNHVQFNTRSTKVEYKVTQHSKPFKESNFKIVSDVKSPTIVLRRIRSGLKNKKEYQNLLVIKNLLKKRGFKVGILMNPRAGLRINISDGVEIKSIDKIVEVFSEICF